MLPCHPRVVTHCRPLSSRFAYCNAKWLVVSSTGEPGVFTANLDDVPFPPGDSSGQYRTGMATLDTTMTEVLYFPLDVVDLEASSPSNNLEVFEGKTYLDDGTNQYGLPADAGTGTAVNGQMVRRTHTQLPQNVTIRARKCVVRPTIA